MKLTSRLFSFALFLSASVICIPSGAQDWVTTGSNLTSHPIRMAAADFKPAGADPQTTPFKAIFDSTLYSDLNNAGIFQMVSKSLARLAAGDCACAVVRRPG
jgi:TolB protein